MGSTSAKAIFFLIIASFCAFIIVEAIYGEDKYLDKFLTKIFKFYKVSDEEKESESEDPNANINGNNGNNNNSGGTATAPNVNQI